jgi:hypothetical protein
MMQGGGPSSNGPSRDPQVRGLRFPVDVATEIPQGLRGACLQAGIADSSRFPPESSRDKHRGPWQVRQSSAIKSISTRTFLGKRDTSTVDRAGGWVTK